MRVGILAALLLIAAGCTQNAVNKSAATGGAEVPHEVKYVTLTVNNFDKEVLQSKQPVLVDFWATWCGPCMAIGPAVASVAVEYEGKAKVGKINVDEQGALAEKYQAESIPLLLVFKDGKIVKRQEGAIGPDYEAMLRKLLDEAIQGS